GAVSGVDPHAAQRSAAPAAEAGSASPAGGRTASPECAPPSRLGAADCGRGSPPRTRGARSGPRSFLDQSLSGAEKRGTACYKPPTHGFLLCCRASAESNSLVSFFLFDLCRADRVESASPPQGS